MDQVQQITEPMKQFAKDSFRLVKKCTKPDRKGEARRIPSLARSIVSVFRVSKDRHGHSDRFCHHGFHRFLRQVDSHSDQQHHRRVLKRTRTRFF